MSERSLLHEAKMIFDFFLKQQKKNTQWKVCTTDISHPLWWVMLSISFFFYLVVCSARVFIIEAQQLYILIAEQSVPQVDRQNLAVQI